MQLCGDPTCQSYGCSSEALDAWGQQMEENAKAIVRAALSGQSVAPSDSGNGPVSAVEEVGQSV